MRPIDRVWSTVRRFDRVVDWNPGVTDARMETGSPTEVGSIRVLGIADGTQYSGKPCWRIRISNTFTSTTSSNLLCDCRNYVSCHRFIEITEGAGTLGIWQGEFDCDPADADELESIIGDRIYRDAQLALDQYLREKA